MNGPSVLLTTDGTYPCYSGGVSVWCDQLVNQLRDTPFHIFAITYSPTHSPLFDSPANVVSQQMLALWGTEEPGVQEGNLSQTIVRKLNTTDAAVRGQFVEAFASCLRCILSPDRQPEELAEALVCMFRYFRQFDYARTMASSIVWEEFLNTCLGHYCTSERPKIEDAVTCMGWLKRYLAVLTAQFPQTDVVHASMAGLAGVPGVIQKQLCGSHFLLTEHGIFVRELYMSLAKMKNSEFCRRFLFSFYEAVARMNYKFADAVTSLCEFNRKWQIRKGAAPSTIRIIPNGVDSIVFHPPEAPASDSGSAPVVLTMARIYPLKGITELIRAARLVLNKLPEVRWRILGGVGDQRYYASCLALAAELGIESSIEWGHTSKPAPEYRRADLVCVPSISEAMPYAVLEAMFSGCPVVATDVGGVSEMLGGTGVVVPPRDAEAMADAIISLLSAGSAGQRLNIAERALHRARSLYTMEKCLKRFSDVYEELSTSRLAALSKAG